MCCAGAGPAGVATAVALVREGVDLARMLGASTGRGSRAPSRAAADSPATRRRRWRPSGSSCAVPHVPGPEGRIVYGRHAARRAAGAAGATSCGGEDFDADLVAQARARGIEVIEGEGLASFEVDAGARAVRVATTAGRAARWARVLVGADGAGSLRAPRRWRATGVPPLRLFPARGAGAARLDLGDRMVYDFSPMDEGLRGYVWLFPVPGGR